MQGRFDINLELLDLQCLLACGRISSLSFVQMSFNWGGGNGFGREKTCRNWGTIAPSTYVQKALISRQT